MSEPKRWSWMLVVGVMALTGGMARAQPGPHGPPPHSPEFLRAAQAAGLSPGQIAQIKKIALASERELIPLQGKVRLAQLDLQEAVEGDAVPPENKVAGLVDRVGQLETQVKKNRVISMLRIRATMSKAQWDKLQALQPPRPGKQPGGPPMPPMPPMPPAPPRP